MDSNDALAIIDSMQVPEHDGVYILGSLDRRVTVLSQQVRALNLAAALFSTGRLIEKQPVVVIGAGIAGLTCTAALQQLGASVTLLEKQDRILPLFRHDSARWIHPHVYDWPNDGWDREYAGLPILDWEQGTVAQLRQQFEYSWQSIRNHISFHTNAHQVRIGNEIADERTVTWSRNSSQRTKVVVLAVGFGIEPKRHSSDYRYWELDDLDHPPPIDGQHRRWLVSGGGDGAFTDLLRLCIEGFRHDRLLRDFCQDPRMKLVEWKIRRIEGDASIQSNPNKLHDAYLAIDAPWIATQMKERQRTHNEVSLSVPSANFLSDRTSPLNRVLVSQLFKAGGFGLVASRTESTDPRELKTIVTFGDRTEGTFDRVILRHGPASALKRDFPAIAHSIEKGEQGQRKDFNDTTRRPLWNRGTFKPLEQARPKQEQTIYTFNAPRSIASRSEDEYFQQLFESVYGEDYTPEKRLKALERIRANEEPYVEKGQSFTTKAMRNRRRLYHVDPLFGSFSDAFESEQDLAYRPIPALRAVAIGSSDQCHIRIDQGGVSHFHAVLHLDVLHDCSSLNGTRLNGLEIARCRVNTGDMVEFGAESASFWYARTEDLLPSRYMPHRYEATLAIDIEPTDVDKEKDKSGHTQQILRYILREAAVDIMCRSYGSLIGKESVTLHLQDVEDCHGAVALIEEACRALTKRIVPFVIFGGVSKGTGRRAASAAWGKLESARLRRLRGVLA